MPKLIVTTREGHRDANSRLGCQIPFTGDLDGLKVTIAAED